MRLKWDREKQLWRVNDWIKVIFSDESRIFISQRDDTRIFLMLFE